MTPLRPKPMGQMRSSLVRSWALGEKMTPPRPGSWALGEKMTPLGPESWANLRSLVEKWHPLAQDPGHLVKKWRPYAHEALGHPWALGEKMTPFAQEAWDQLTPWCALKNEGRGSMGHFRTRCPQSGTPFGPGAHGLAHSRCALIFEGRDLDHPLPPEAWVMHRSFRERSILGWKKKVAIPGI